MTVRELIETLKLFDQDSPILVYDPSEMKFGNSGYMDVGRVYPIKVAPKAKGTTFYARFINLPEQNCMTAVVIE